LPYSNQLNRNIGVFLQKKMFFVTLPFRNGLEYRNASGQIRSSLNVATSRTNSVMFGAVTPEKGWLIFVLLWKKLQKWAYWPIISTHSTDLDQLFSFDRHIWVRG